MYELKIPTEEQMIEASIKVAEYVTKKVAQLGEQGFHICRAIYTHHLQWLQLRKQVECAQKVWEDAMRLIVEQQKDAK